MSDLGLIIGSSALSLVLIFISLRFSKKYALYSLAAFVVYSAYLYYGLFYRGEGGTSLVWLFYLLIINGLHTLLSLANIVYDVFYKHKNKG